MILIFLLLPVFSMFLTGCEPADDPYAEAVELYGRKEYSAAEPFFVRAIESGDKRNEVLIGHAYNLLQLENYTDAISELMIVQELVTDNATATRIHRALRSAYLAQKNYAGVARVDDELSRLISDQKEATDLAIEASVIRADLYEARGDKEQYETELRKLIELREFAPDEYGRLYELASSDPDHTARLKIVDEYIMYIRGHSAYVTDYLPSIALIFEAARVAKYAEYEHDREYYFEKAEEFMELAVNEGAPEEDMLKFKIVIAEQRGKNVLAYKLLGVYLNHCPDDGLARKEMEYLENRIGLE